jgi:hypothetical protein
VVIDDAMDDETFGAVYRANGWQARNEWQMN